MKIQFTFAFPVIRALELAGIGEAGRNVIRSAVCAAIGQVRSADAESKVKLGLTKKGEASVRVQDVIASKGIASVPLRLAYLSQELDRLDGLGICPPTIELPAELLTWCKEREASRVKREEDAKATQAATQA